MVHTYKTNPKPPEPTYEITGLTEEQFRILGALAYRSDFSGSDDIFRKVIELLDISNTRYRVQLELTHDIDHNQLQPIKRT